MARDIRGRPRYRLIYRRRGANPVPERAGCVVWIPEIDDDLIARVRILLGTRSIKETIDEALHEVERQDARRREIRALIEMDGLDLADERVMAKTWRY